MKIYDFTMEHYRFSGQLIRDIGFINHFKNSRHLRENYRKLRDAFIEHEEDDNFCLCYKELISDDFINFFFQNCKPMLRLSPNNDCEIDPLTSISFSCSLFNEEDFPKIQESLLHIYHCYGSTGLTVARSCSLTMGITNDHFLVVDDKDDIYDLPKYEWEEPTDKLLVLSNQDFDLIQRVDDLCSSEAFSLFPDENVKSALFAFPQLIYRNGKIISDDELYSIMKTVNSQMDEHSNELNFSAFWEADRVCSDIYLDNNRNTLPLKHGERSTQYVKE